MATARRIDPAPLRLCHRPDPSAHHGEGRGGDGQEYEVRIHLHRTQSRNSNPLQTPGQETAQRIRMRQFSHRAHAYIARARQEGTLGWLGGPWALTYAELGLPGPMNPANQTPQPNVRAIFTDSTHIHHIHISMGTDQR